jgi:hypothetical protein
MTITRAFSGFCPTLNKDYSIEVGYTDARTLDNPNRYIQGMATCNHYAFSGDCPILMTCPIRAKAPKEISG